MNIGVRVALLALPDEEAWAKSTGRPDPLMVRVLPGGLPRLASPRRAERTDGL